MDKFWLKSYPAGVPAEVDITQYESLVELLEESFKRNAKYDAYDCMSERLRYADVDKLSLQFGAYLQSLGLEAGTRIALMMPNVLPYPVAVAAVLRAGYVVVNVNPLYTARELKHQLNDSEAAAIVILENFATTLEAVIHETKIRHSIVVKMGDLLGFFKGPIVNLVVRHLKKLVPSYSLPNAISFKHALYIGAKTHFRAVVLTRGSIAFLQYTGGTTGVSKGAMLSHGNIIANVLQSDAWLQPALNKPPKVDQLVIVCALPLYHIFALTACCLVGMRLGAMNILVTNPRDIDGFVKTLTKFRINMLPAVNTLYNALLNHPDFAALDFSRLKVSNGGGMAVQKAVADRWMKVTGCPIAEGYGLSETSPIATCNPADAVEYNGTIGLPFPSTDIAILDDMGRALPVGEAGEVAIRGPQVMLGYWKQPKETANVMTTDGFFKSGDIGIMDERGYVRIVDRKKDMILVSGFNVYPNEIEAVVSAHPSVLECACVGVPDPASGEAVKLFVVRKDATLTSLQLMDYCREQLTAYKKPKHIEFRSDLPKTNVGKILRRELRDETTSVI
jgi:long-chain acyl-CoA synthetase